MGDMALDPRCWPDPAGMVAALNALNITLMITHWPYMVPESTNFPTYQANGWLAANATDWNAPERSDLFCLGGAVMDPFSAPARNATVERWYAGYGKYLVNSTGAVSVWLDETEPDHEGYSFGNWRFSSGAYSDDEVGAGWTSAWLQMFADAFAALGLPPERRFVLSRAVRAGTARHGFAMWSGDVGCKFPVTERTRTPPITKLTPY